MYSLREQYQCIGIRPKKVTLVSGNAGDEKKLHPGGHKFIFFNQFSRDILFSSLVYFDFFDSSFLVVCFVFFVVFVVF